ncbi:hypothetical protein YIM730264_21370 [Thermus hydrothermalis]
MRLGILRGGRKRPDGGEEAAKGLDGRVEPRGHTREGFAREAFGWLKGAREL